MKKILLLAAIVLLCNFSFGQLAKKYVLIEQFTQASCGPCAAENPGFRANILIPYEGKMHHIAYHTSWPGVDPMYNYNTSQSASRVTYYGVTGVPTFETMGSDDGVTTQEMIDDAAALGSPLKVVVTQTVNGANLDVRVSVITVGTPPTGTFAVRTAIVEKNVNYTTAPGNNGEKYFPDVFRNMLPNTTGSAFTPAAQGDSVVYNYTFPISGVWDINEIYSIAFVQKSNKEVINSGSSLDLPSGITYGNINIATPPYQTGAPSTPTTFNATVTNGGATADNFFIRLTSNQPGSWASSFTINGTTYSDTVTLSIAGGATENLTIDVLPDASAGIGTYTLTMQASDTTTLTLTKKMNVISGVTDLVVSNSSLKGGTGPENASAWANKYTSGLTFAGSTTYTTTDENIFIGFNSAGALTGVTNLYLNIGWTFPGLTDALVQELTTFLDNGGHLLIGGQDLGWDTWDLANGGNGTSTTQAFYTNYLNASFVDDGVSTNSSLIANAADPIFGTVPTSNLVKYYGTTYFYPDEISPAGLGQPIFYYTGGVKVAGVRATNGSYKVVYLGVGIEMLNTTTGNNVMKLAYDWFNGVTSTAQFDAGMLALSQSPNPATDVLNINFKALEATGTLNVTDVQGKVILSQPVDKNEKEIKLNVGALPAGIYFYNISTAGTISKTEKFTVIK